METGWIAVGEVNNPAPDCYVERVGTEGYAIILQSGLCRLIYRVARIVATRFRAMGEEGPAQGAGIEETARLVAEVLWWFQETGQSFGPDYWARPEDRRICIVD